jgi:hypothetical protein
MLVVYCTYSDFTDSPPSIRRAGNVGPVEQRYERRGDEDDAQQGFFHVESSPRSPGLALRVLHEGKVCTVVD